MRVGIDGRAFTSPSAGVRRYVRGLVPALLALGESLEIVALGGTEAPPGLEHVAEPAHLPTNLGWAISGLRRAAARARVDVIHAPAYTGPLWGGIPVVLTIHDVSYARHPEWYPYRSGWLRRAFYRRSAHAAAHILTDSEFSASEIVAAYGISRDRLTVVPLGVSDSFADTTTPPHLPRTEPSHPRTLAPSHPANTAPSHLPAPEPSHLRTLAPSHPAPFLLHVGDLHTRRNLPMVSAAVLAARRRLDLPLSLVLAGVDRGVSEELVRLAAGAGVPQAIVCLGSVDDSRLRELYRDAVALVYPSRYEGFGLPVLEAMACGTPVIAARAGSIPEVLGDAGTLLEPDDARGWEQAMVAIVRDSELRVRMSAQGRARAAEFTWARTARATAGIYRRVSRTRG